MKTVKKAIIMLLTVILITASWAGFKADAKVSQPVIKLKKINNGTGVKIIIEKTHGAEGYFVYMTKRKDAYKNYLYGKGVDTIELGVINKNGKKQREFIINGLPEGKYTFMVEAFMLDQNGDPEPNKSKFSEAKTVKIKAPENIATAQRTYDFPGVKAGDTISFGAYEQDDLMENGKEPIEWIVLEKDEDEMLLLSKYALDVLPYNKKHADLDWAGSSLRKWLNGYFCDTAFSDSEKKLIAPAELENPANPFYDLSEAGKNTVDNVFLLSLEDMVNVEYSFGTDTDGTGEKIDEYDKKNAGRICTATEYARALGLWTAGESDASCYWWLRTPGNNNTNAADVLYDGSVSIGGTNVYMREGIRPAIRVKLE